jgi:hypothetical protein
MLSPLSMTISPSFLSGRFIPVFVLVLLVLALSAKPAKAQSPASYQADVQLLTEGVKVIDAIGAVPGPMAVYGPQSFPVVVGSVGKNLTGPLVVAGRLGSGRIVALGHGGFLSATDKADTGKFIQNTIRWSASRTTAKPNEIKVGVLRNDSLVKYLKAQGFAVTVLDQKDWTTKLTGLNTVVADSGNWSSMDTVKSLGAYIRSGGGLVTAGLGWGWLQLNPGKSLSTDNLGNKLLSEAGIIWMDGTLSRTAKNGFTVSPAVPAVLHSGRALDALLSVTNSATPAAQQLLAQASWIVTETAQTISTEDRLYYPRLKTIKEKSSGKIPTAKAPLKTADAFERLALTLELQTLKKTPLKQIKAHPAAADFPGSVAAEAERSGKTIRLNTKQRGWHSTGLYAAPGEIIKITIPESEFKDKLLVRIGCHTDRLWDHASWSRAPEISTSKLLNTATTETVNAFGGLIYIDVPNGLGEKDFSVSIAGAVQAPYFVLGKTSETEWKSTLRNYPAPWAELESGKVIFTVPSSAIRELDNPAELMEYWNRVMDGIADLATTPRERTKPERIVADVQISAGYMHSGYPIMTHLDVVGMVVDTKALTTKGSWGHYHELGHNHQAPEWTFDGTTEVTCNLFSLYVYDQVLKLGLQGHNAIGTQARERNLKQYFGNGAKFEEWKKEPFIALTMYYQLIEAFGWDAFKKTFAEYRALPKEQRPKNDDEERDQWLVRFSKTVGKNLGPFFEAWQVPTSQAARDSIKDLPGWMPEQGFPDKYRSK